MTTKLRGAAILRDPRLNKSNAFTEAERETLGLVGLLSESIDSEDIQVRRILQELEQQSSNFDKYAFLCALQDTDETLFYRLLRSDPARFLPLVYTPTVGEACLQFSHMTRRPRALYISIKRRGRIKEILGNWPQSDVRFIVVTSGERILGLCDLGANGMGIPSGKLALYTVCGGVPPQFTVPVMLDCGTNNESILRDRLYMGLRQNRPKVAELDEFVDEFVTAVQERFPNCCVQFEDWARADAFRLLGRYRDRICCFNDDIQGSGAAVLAGIRNALRITGGELARQTFLLLGAGAAGVGISDLLTEAMALEGLSGEQARARIWLFNRNGLIESTRGDLSDVQRPYAHHHAPTADFVAAIESLKPNAIIGVSTAAHAFDQRVIEAMTRINQRPIIFALSNPTSRSECSADEAYRWSEGRAVFASGSPFPPVQYRGRTLVPGQCNNMYIFPAVGLAIYATRASRVTDEMFVAVAEAVAEQVTPAELDKELTYPPQSRILKAEIYAAERISKVIFARGFARVQEPKDLGPFIESQVYEPEYRSLV